jgi:hypothetical protein
MDQTRRTFLASGAAAIATATAGAEAFAQWRPSERYPDPAIQVLDPRLQQVPDRHRGGRAYRHRNALGRGAGLVRRRALSPVERHPEQRDHALGRSDGPRQRLPQAIRLFQRQHPRPAGPARHLRARGTAGDAHRIRRRDHGVDRPLRGQAPQLAKRRGGEIRRLDLVHRSALRHRASAPIPSCRRTSTGSTARARRPSSRGRCAVRTGSASRPTRARCTSSRRAPRRTA